MTIQRNKYFDFLRGIAILMVIGIHTFDRFGFDPHHDYFVSIIRQILNAAVPIFFAISGFFLSKKDLAHKEQRLKFWKHQIPKIYYPMLIWGVPWLFFKLQSGQDPLMSVILWVFGGLSIFYFIAVTIQYYLLLPVIQRITPPAQCNINCNVSD